MLSVMSVDLVVVANFGIVEALGCCVCMCMCVCVCVCVCVCEII